MLFIDIAPFSPGGLHSSAGLEDNPFAVFTFLVAPAILTNACTLLALGTSNRLARGVDRARAIAAVLVSDSQGQSASASIIPRELAQAQFEAASGRCRMLLGALRSFYLAIGSFGAGTCVAMLGAAMAYFGNQDAGQIAMTAMLCFSGIGVLALIYGAICMVRESTLTLSMLKDEQLSLEARVRTLLPETTGK
jgi:hypothetical protein